MFELIDQDKNGYLSAAEIQDAADELDAFGLDK